MSHGDQPRNLAEALMHYRFAYLLTTAAGDAPHAVPVQPSLEDGELVVKRLGRHSCANVSVRPAVAMVWPPSAESDYSLLVDGRGRIVDQSLRIVPTHALLSRLLPAAQSAAGSRHLLDCVDVELPPLGAGTS